MAIYYQDKPIALKDIPNGTAILNVFLHEVYNACGRFDFHIEGWFIGNIIKIKVTYEDVELVDVNKCERNNLPAVRINGRVTTKIDRAKKLFYSWAVIPSVEEIISSKEGTIGLKISCIFADLNRNRVRSPYSSLIRLPDKVMDRLFGSLELTEALKELLISAGADREILTKFFEGNSRALEVAYIKSEFEKGNGYLLCKLSRCFLVRKNKVISVCEDPPEEIKRQVGLLKLASDEEGVALVPNVGCKLGGVYFVLGGSM